jgi:hypothetical protein
MREPITTAAQQEKPRTNQGEIFARLCAEAFSSFLTPFALTKARTMVIGMIIKFPVSLTTDKVSLMAVPA